MMNCNDSRTDSVRVKLGDAIEQALNEKFDIDYIADFILTLFEVKERDHGGGMSKVTDDCGKWADTASRLAYKFHNAVEYARRSDEFDAGMDMMEPLQETVAALRSGNDWRR